MSTILMIIGLSLLAIVLWGMIGAVILALFLPNDVLDHLTEGDDQASRDARIIASYVWPWFLTVCLLAQRRKARARLAASADRTGPRMPAQPQPSDRIGIRE